MKQRLFATIVLGALLLGFQTSAGVLAQFNTVFGELEVELFDQDKPATVANFIRYVESGSYTNMFAHRLNPDFVLQGGGFYVANRGAANQGIASIPTFAAITNEYNVGRRLSNVYGTLAMARVGGVTNSATSQWFFNLTNNAFLDNKDGGFTVFGRVVRGTNVLNQFRTFRPDRATNTIVNLDGAALSELPVLRSNPTYDDLIYIDVSLLRLAVRNVPAGREISWNSVSNIMNYVEFTTAFPPAWQTLVATNGTGNRPAVIDTNISPRFYRVRIGY